jgi:hypothetical protein
VTLAVAIAPDGGPAKPAPAIAASFYGDTLPLDHFIAKYRGLLRELAHV